MLAFRSQLAAFGKCRDGINRSVSDEFFDARVEFIRPQAFHRTTLWPHLENVRWAVLHRAVAQFRADDRLARCGGRSAGS